jgi:endoglucanase
MKRRKTMTVLAAMMLTSALSVQAQKGVAIHVNQVGYFPNEEKVVVVEGIGSKTKLTVTDSNGATVLEPSVMRTAVSPWSKKKRQIVDVSELKVPGRYTISVKGVSRDFVITPQALHNVSLASLKLFYLMRSGVPIEKEYAGKYARPAGHLDTYVLIHPSAASKGRPAGSVISSPLGWYDAGDYNKYVVNSSFSIGLMLGVYEQNKDYFDKLNTNIPESCNATADLLDEMMFNLRWLLTMQDPEDGGVYHKLTTPNFEGFVKPTDCHQPRYVVPKSVTATYDFAAVMAQSARLLKGNRDYMAFATQAEAAARKAYVWAKAHPTAFYRQEVISRDFQPAVSTGTYGDMVCQDECFWAASELYRLTGEDAFLRDALETMPQKFTVPTWGNVAGLGAFAWIASPQSEMRQAMVKQLKDYCEELITSVPISSFQSSFGDKASDFGWGCLAEQCCVPAIALLYADRFISPGRYRACALQNANYLFGQNATDFCYVTGFGQKSPMHPHHRISASDDIVEPLPGMLVGGPNPGLQDNADGSIVYPSTYPDEAYVDDERSYASNEIAINWNASLVGLIGWLDAIYGAK